MKEIIESYNFKKGTVGYLRMELFAKQIQKDFKEKIETEIAINKEIQIIPESGQAWTQEYKEGYIDGLIRSLKLLELK